MRIPQARILEWVAVSSSRGSSQSKDQTQVSPHYGQILYHLSTRETHKECRNPELFKVMCKEGPWPPAQTHLRSPAGLLIPQGRRTVGPLKAPCYSHGACAQAISSAQDVLHSPHSLLNSCSAFKTQLSRYLL